MKYMVRCYRLLKPVVICTSYLFTSMVLLCLMAHGLSGERFPVTAELLRGLFAFSLGSIGLQRVCLEPDWPKLPYPVRLSGYICAVALWGWLCMRFFMGFGFAKTALFWPVGLGVLCCAGLELFNRVRARVYNTLLTQYKKRKQ